MSISSRQIYIKFTKIRPQRQPPRSDTIALLDSRWRSVDRRKQPKARSGIVTRNDEWPSIPTQSLPIMPQLAGSRIDVSLICAKNSEKDVKLSRL